MAPATLLPEPSFQLEVMEKSPKELHNFGATITGLDLNNISDTDVKHLKEAIWTHKLVVVRGQKDLDPKKHWELVTRFDPDAPQVHSHGDMKTFKAKGGMLAKYRDVKGIPGAENVRLIGKGFQGEDHYGIKNHSMLQGPLHEFHLKPLPLEKFNEGHTRFQRWHIDAPLYERDPAWITVLRCIKQPKGHDITINWDDGSGYSMKSRPGRTAYVSNFQLYEMFSPDEQRMADHSWVEYYPHPYMAIEHCHGNPNGLGLESEGKEHTLDEIDYEEAEIKKYPMVWLNPITGEKAFQVHGICARKLYIRNGPNESPRIIDDLKEIRKFLADIQLRILKPQYVLLPQVDEGDVVMWDNYGLFHSAVDYPLERHGPRTMHQANIGASRGPVGPVPVPV